MWWVHCALLDERIFSEEEAKLQAVFGLHVKDMQLLIEVTVFGLSESITVPFYSRDAAVVVSGVCASESVSKMWMVYLCICIMSFGLVCVLRPCVLVCTCVLV